MSKRAPEVVSTRFTRIDRTLRCGQGQVDDDFDLCMVRSICHFC